MTCRHCGKQTPDDSIYCELCGGDIRQNTPPPQTLSHRQIEPERKKPKKVLKTVVILLVILLMGAGIWFTAARIFSPEIVLSGGGEYDVYKDYVENSGENDYTLINEYSGDSDYGGDIEIPLSDITGNWYILLRTYIDGSDEFSTEAEYTAVLDAKDAFDIKFTCTLYDGYNADGSEFKPGKWHLRPASGSFYLNVLAFYFPGKGLEIVFIPNRLMYGEPGRFIDVSYDEKSFFGKTTTYQMIIVKLP